MDIVKQLRMYPYEYTRKAADEIEALRREAHTWSKACEAATTKLHMGAMSKYPEHGAHQFCGDPACVICALTAEEVKAIWLACTSIDNEVFCGEFSRKLLAAAVAAANKTPNDQAQARARSAAE